LITNKFFMIHFTKMHGAGNDYIYLDCFQYAEPADPASLSVQMSDRHTGIGGDGLILICPSETAQAKMRMFNADGSESEMCGNGIRCVGKYLYDHKLVAESEFDVETGAGILHLVIESENGVAEQVRVDMGEPILQPTEIPTTFSGEQVVARSLQVDDRAFEVTAVSMGNPHCVVFVDNATDELVHGWGPKIETHAAFPNRTNVEFVEIISPAEVRQRTWERGSGETLACGTGAAAVCVAGVLNAKSNRELTVHLLGGSLKMHWDETTNHVFKTGPAVEVFSGVWQRDC
jgi:diaminopimelate epimerase